jgi:type IV pilus assembly protein PilA
VKSLSFRPLLFSFAFVFPLAAAQTSSPPQVVLEDLATSDSPDTIVLHLPVSVLQKLDKLPATDRAAVLEKLSLRKNLEREGVTLRRTEEGNGWEIVNKKGGIEATMTLKPPFIAGPDALVPIELHHEQETVTLLVSMKLEDGDWRVTDFGPWRHTSVEGIFLQEESRSGAGPSESAAASTLRTLNTALVTYSSTYPQVGYPANLAQMSGRESQQPSPDHALLLDSAFLSEPLIRNGYEFHYVLLNSGAADSEARYQITATPVQYGKNTAESFFTDQTAVLRFTTENRPANENDEPLR